MAPDTAGLRRHCGQSGAVGSAIENEQTMSEDSGTIIGINGNLLTVEFTRAVVQNEVAYAVMADRRLKAEVIRIRGSYADLQVFEDTTGLKEGDRVKFTGELLAVELGPGLLTQVFDGLQNPLPQLAEHCGFFLQRGVYLDALPRDRLWAFTPTAAAGRPCHGRRDARQRPRGHLSAPHHGPLQTPRSVYGRADRRARRLHRQPPDRHTCGGRAMRWSR
jgi:hypothetical protein